MMDDKVQINDDHWSCMVVIIEAIHKSFIDYMKIIPKAFLLNPYIVPIQPQTLLERKANVGSRKSYASKSLKRKSLAKRQSAVKKQMKSEEKGKETQQESEASGKENLESKDKITINIKQSLASQIKNFILEYKNMIVNKMEYDKKRGVYVVDSSRGNPSPGPHIYFIVTGFRDPNLFLDLIREDVPLYVGISIGPDNSLLFKEALKEQVLENLQTKLREKSPRLQHHPPRKSMRKSSVRRQSSARKQSLRRQSQQRRQSVRSTYSPTASTEEIGTTVTAENINTNIDKLGRYWIKVKKLLDHEEYKEITKNVALGHFDPSSFKLYGDESKRLSTIALDLSNFLFEFVKHMRHYIHFMNSCKITPIQDIDMAASLFPCYELLMENITLELTTIEIILFHMVEVVSNIVSNVEMPSTDSSAEFSTSSFEVCDPLLINHKNRIQINLFELSSQLNLSEIHSDIYKFMPYSLLWKRHPKLSSEKKIRYESLIYKMWRCSGTVILQTESFKFNLHQMIFNKLLNLYFQELKNSFDYLEFKNKENIELEYTKMVEINPDVNQQQELIANIEEDVVEEQEEDIAKPYIPPIVDPNHLFLDKFLNCPELESLFDTPLTIRTILNCNTIEEMEQNILLQSIQNSFSTYPSLYYEYFLPTDKIIFWFQNDLNLASATIDVQKGHLRTTGGGFREFHNTIRHEIKPWLESQQKLIQDIDNNLKIDYVKKLKLTKHKNVTSDQEYLLDDVQYPLPRLGGPGGDYDSPIYDISCQGTTNNETVKRFVSIDGPSITIKELENLTHLICFEFNGNIFTTDLQTINPPTDKSNSEKESFICSIESKNGTRFTIEFEFEIPSKTSKEMSPIQTNINKINELLENSNQSSEAFTAESTETSRKSSKRSIKSKRAFSKGQASSMKHINKPEEIESPPKLQETIDNLNPPKDIESDEETMKYVRVNPVITLPNGCKVSFMGDGNEIFVKQEYPVTEFNLNCNVNESKRIFLKDGTILLYKLNGDLIIITPNSTVYKILEVKLVEQSPVTKKTDTETTDSKLKISPEGSSVKADDTKDTLSPTKLRKTSHKKNKKPNFKKTKKVGPNDTKPKSNSPTKDSDAKTEPKCVYKVFACEKVDWSGQKTVYNNISEVIDVSQPYKIRAAVLKGRELYVKRSDGTTCFYNEDGVLCTKFPDQTLITSVPAISIPENKGTGYGSQSKLSVKSKLSTKSQTSTGTKKSVANQRAVSSQSQTSTNRKQSLFSDDETANSLKKKSIDVTMESETQILTPFPTPEKENAVATSEPVTSKTPVPTRPAKKERTVSAKSSTVPKHLVAFDQYSLDEIPETEFEILENSYIMEHPKFARVVNRNGIFELKFEEFTYLIRNSDNDYSIKLDDSTFIEIKHGTLSIDSFNKKSKSLSNSKTTTKFYPFNANKEGKILFCSSTDSTGRNFKIYSDGSTEFNLPYNVDPILKDKISKEILLRNRFFVMNRDLSGYELIPEVAILGQPPNEKQNEPSPAFKRIKKMYYRDINDLPKIKSKVNINQYYMTSTKTDKFRIPYFYKNHRSFKLKQKDLSDFLPIDKVWLFELPEKIYFPLCNPIAAEQELLLDNASLASSETKYIDPMYKEEFKPTEPPLAVIFKKEITQDPQVNFFKIYKDAFYNYIWYSQEILERYLNCFHILKLAEIKIPQPTINVNLLIKEV